MENWKEYTRVLLLTPNKYTGLPLAQDPCVAFLNLMNEDGTIACHTQFPKIKAIYDRLWDEYKAQNRIDETKYPGAHNKWLSDLQIKCIQEMTRFLREEIKTKALITDLNWLNSTPSDATTWMSWTTTITTTILLSSKKTGHSRMVSTSPPPSRTAPSCHET